MISQAGLHATVYYMKLGECFQNNNSGRFLATIKHRQTEICFLNVLVSPQAQTNASVHVTLPAFVYVLSRDSGDISGPSAAAVSR